MKEEAREKDTLAVIHAYSLRELIDRVNANNRTEGSQRILREDVVNILKTEDSFALLYFR